MAVFYSSHLAKQLAIVTAVFAVFAVVLIPVANASHLYPYTHSGGGTVISNNNNNSTFNNNVNQNTNTNTITFNVPQYQPPVQYYPPQPPVYYPPQPQPQPLPVYACSNGIDDDGDGRIDLSDPGCTDYFDNSEFNQTAVINPAPTVLGTRVIYVTAAPAPQTYVYQPLPVTQVVTASAGCTALRIFDLGVYNDANQNVIVRFQTTCPANGYVRYGLASEFEKTGNFTYPFTSQSTGGVTGFATVHQVNLGKLAMNQTYFLRAFATSGNVTAFSVELAFVQLPAGVQVVGDTNNPTVPVTSASAYNTIGGFFLNPWFLLLLIIALVVAIILALRRRAGVVSTTGPIEINA